ncbi:MAG: glycosyltransferase family 4 protein [Pseudomonadota bacterium]
MKLLFVHQNMPGQYREMVTWLRDQGGHDITFLTQRDQIQIKGVRKVMYTSHHKAGQNAYGLSRVWEDATGMGYGAALAMQRLHNETGWKPDIILGHTGWGELLFMKQVFPDVPMLGFFEFYYEMEGGIVGFSPDDKSSVTTPFIMESRNAVPNSSWKSADMGTTPTFWQRDRFPKVFHDRLYVCHDGIRTDRLVPDPNVSLKVGRVDEPLTRKDEVFTYMARNLEPSRGFFSFMRALPKIQRERPNARCLVIGGNDVSYGSKSKDPGGFRGEMTKELGDQLDWSRLHFLGKVPYNDYMKIIQLSKCHMYLTKPFVLSWSFLEAMSMQATIVASDVAPVREAMTHGKNGLLVDFHNSDQIADQVIDVLAQPGKYTHIGPAARKHVVDTYDFHTVCLPEHIRQINALVPASAGHIAVPDH